MVGDKKVTCIYVIIARGSVFACSLLWVRCHFLPVFNCLLVVFQFTTFLTWQLFSKAFVWLFWCLLEEVQ